ncbi:MAG: TrkH family potassium uptake protein [Paracoccaceae bacterium]
MNFVFFTNGLVLIFFAALMGGDALIFHETATVFGFSAMLVGLIGTALSLASSSSFLGLHRLHTFILTTSVWLTAAVAGAVPLYLWSLSPADALFEAMSGITTTGSTVMSGLDATPHGIILWRALLQGVGGVGFIVTGIALLPILKVGGMQLFRTESSDKGEKELRNATMFASATLKIYLGLIALCALVYLVGGMSFFEAVTHAMTTLSTGGYSGYDASFGHFQSPFLQWSATLFMLLGAFPFAWYIRGVYRGSLRSEQVSAMIWSLGAVIGTLTLWLSISDDMNVFVALRLTAFNVVSVVTTTGYATTDYTLWGPFAVSAFFFLTAVGGCTGSTAGGAKAVRWLIFGRAVKAQIQRIHSPSRVTTIKYEGRRVDDDVISGVLSFFVLYAVTFAIMSVVLTLLGLDITTATSGALTALANVGPGIGSIIGPAGNFSTLTDPQKLVLSLGMFLGRLEMLTVFVLISPVFWREVGVFR